MIAGGKGGNIPKNSKYAKRTGENGGLCQWLGFYIIKVDYIPGYWPVGDEMGLLASTGRGLFGRWRPISGQLLWK